MNKCKECDFKCHDYAYFQQHMLKEHSRTTMNHQNNRPGRISKVKGGSQSKDTKPVNSTWTATFSPILRFVYHARYDYDKATLDEWYELQEKYITLFRHREKWCQKSTWRYPDGGRAYTRFDIKRAKKLATDFGIEVPEPTHRLSAWRTKAQS